MGHIAVILAGGKSRRMGRDKALIEIGGRRLIDIVAARLAPQCDRVLISGSSDYGLDLEKIADLVGIEGPAAGVLSAARRLAREQGFVTAPVDGPFLPADLVARLTAAGASAVASDGAAMHPTFAWWRCADIERSERAFVAGGSRSLKRLAALAGSKEVVWGDARLFDNFNTPADIERGRAADC